MTTTAAYQITLGDHSNVVIADSAEAAVARWRANKLSHDPKFSDDPKMIVRVTGHVLFASDYSK